MFDFFDAFFDDGFQIEVTFDSIIFDSVPPGNSYGTSEEAHFKEEQSSLIFPFQALHYMTEHSPNFSLTLVKFTSM